jgi:hypothetical protein
MPPERNCATAARTAASEAVTHSFDLFTAVASLSERRLDPGAGAGMKFEESGTPTPSGGLTASWLDPAGRFRERTAQELTLPFMGERS